MCVLGGGGGGGEEVSLTSKRAGGSCQNFKQKILKDTRCLFCLHGAKLNVWV